MSQDKAQARPLSMWTIYERPRDYPTHFVTRRIDVHQGFTVHTDDFHLCSSLEVARQHVPGSAVNIGREPADDPVIVETWL